MTRSAPPRKHLSHRAGPARMEEVARLAGVSAITVSRVLNHPDKVAADTRARVEDAIARIGYLPNLTAGSLASNRSRTVAALVPTIANSIFAETVQGLSDALAARGYQLLLGQTNYSPATEDALVAVFLGRRVDGLVLTGVAHSQATRKRLLGAGLPVIETWDLTPAPIDMLVGFSNYAAGHAMTRHLLERGYRNIGFIGGEDERSAARRAGFAGAIREAGLVVGPSCTLPPPTSMATGRAALARMIELHPGVRAVFFTNDALAVGGLLECQRRGIAVPERLAIAGFADLDIAAQVSPALTTVQVRGRAIGERAAAMLLARVSGEPIAEPVVDLGFEVIVRAST